MQPGIKGILLEKNLLIMIRINQSVKLCIALDNISMAQLLINCSTSAVEPENTCKRMILFFNGQSKYPGAYDNRGQLHLNIECLTLMSYVGENTKMIKY